MKNCIYLILVLTLSSCGFQTELITQTSSEGFSIESTSVIGTRVGVVEVDDVNCSFENISYVNMFSVNSSGILELGMSNPPVGRYDVEVDVSCPSGFKMRESVTVNIIAPMSPSIVIPVTPWLRHMGQTSLSSLSASGIDRESCQSIDTDQFGNVYCGGYTESSLVEANAGSADIMLMKFSADGVPLWIRQVGAVTAASLSGNAAGYDNCNRVSVDQVNSFVYCFGQTNSSIGESSAGGADAIVLKFDFNGNLIWSRQLGAVTAAANSVTANQTESCNSGGIDHNGSVFCSGYTQSSLVETNAGNEDVFIWKLDSNGNTEWIRHLGLTTASANSLNAGNRDYCHASVSDSSGNIYCTGNTRSSLAETNAGQDDIFILKYSSSGSFLWARQIGSTTLSSFAGNGAANDSCRGIGVDSADNVYCSGYTQGSLGEANGYVYDAVMLKYSSAGVIQWLKQYGGPTSTALGFSNSSNQTCDAGGVDPSGNVYCAGTSAGTFSESGAGGFDALVIKVDTDGNHLWAKQLGSTSAASLGGVNASSGDRCYGFALDNVGNVFCSGFTISTLVETRAGDFDAFLMKLNSTGDIL